MKSKTELFFLNRDGSSFIVRIVKSNGTQKVFFENEYNDLECLTPHMFMEEILFLMDSNKIELIAKL